MSANEPVDIAIFTVIHPELEAVLKVLSVNEQRDRFYEQGTIYWRGQKYSRLLDGQLKLIIYCSGKPTEAQASTGISKIIERFDPAIIILVGIAAGWKDQIKIGDVLTPRVIADFTHRVKTDKGESYLFTISAGFIVN
jgi:nucleoside phosphorylase